MGCWNGSCMISGLPIKCGDKAVAIPMVQHPNGDLSVTFFPIFGEYNDYGSLENVKSNKHSARLVKLVLETGSHSKRKGIPKKEDPTLTNRIKEIGNRFSEGKPVTEEEKDLFFNFLQARSNASSIELDEPAFLFGGQWEYSFEKGKDIQDEADLVQIMEREFVRKDTFLVLYQGKWMPVIMNLIHRDVWDAFSIPSHTKFMKGSSSLELFQKFDDSQLSKGRIAKDLFNAVGMQGYGYTYFPLFGVSLFEEDIISIIGKGEKNYPKPLLDLYQLGRMLFSLRKSLCPPVLVGSQSENFDAVKKLAEAMLKVVEKHPNSEEFEEE